jgi:hypothetical protein
MNNGGLLSHLKNFYFALRALRQFSAFSPNLSSKISDHSASISLANIAVRKNGCACVPVGIAPTQSFGKTGN